MSSLAGKVVLITGASSGFGEDAARLFAKEGCKVVLAARRLDRLQQLAEQIQQTGGEALALPLDITERSEIDLMVQSAIEFHGRIDILFNNAGFGRVGWFEAHEPGRDIQTLMQVNLVGLILVTHAVLPHMLARGEGHIINMSSVAGLVGTPSISVYSATKFGVRGFTDALRREVAPLGLRVSGIYPGHAHTEFGLRSGGRAQRDPNIYKRLAWIYMPSDYVARKVVDLAKHPRRALVIPWWHHVTWWAAENLPWLVDWIVDAFYIRPRRSKAGAGK